MKSPRNMWKAVILVGGPEKGTRFRPLSLDVPKPLFPVAGYPMVQHHIEACAKIPEIKEIFLIGFYPKTEEFGKFINLAKKKYSISIEYLPEHTALGTAGGLYHYRDQILAGSPAGFFVFNSDVCCNFPLKDILLFHQKKVTNDGITMVATEATNKESLNYGCVVKNPQTDEATHYVEKPETFVSALINCGVYVFSPCVLEKLADIFRQHQAQKYEENCESTNNEQISLEKEVLPLYTNVSKMFVFETSSSWGQIKSAASAIHANKLYLSHLHTTDPGKLAKNSDGKPRIVGDVFIDSTASVHSSAVLGPNVTIDRDVVIGKGVRVSNSIVLPGAELKDQCCILNAIIGWDSKVGEWSRVEGSPQLPDPNAKYAKIKSGKLFDDDGRLIPSITVLGRNVDVVSEIIVLNSIVLPHKHILSSSKNQIIL